MSSITEKLRQIYATKIELKSSLDTESNVFEVYPDLVDTTKQQEQAAQTAYNEVKTAYTYLETSYTNLDNAYTNLNTSYNTLETSYTTLDNAYTNLNTAYGTLEVSYTAANEEISYATTLANDIMTSSPWVARTFTDEELLWVGGIGHVAMYNYSSGLQYPKNSIEFFWQSDSNYKNNLNHALVSSSVYADGKMILTFNGLDAYKNDMLSNYLVSINMADITLYSDPKDHSKGTVKTYLHDVYIDSSDNFFTLIYKERNYSGNHNTLKNKTFSKNAELNPDFLISTANKIEFVYKDTENDGYTVTIKFKLI